MSTIDITKAKQNLFQMKNGKKYIIKFSKVPFAKTGTFYFYFKQKDKPEQFIFILNST